MRVGLLSDSHGFLDPAIFNYFAECDEVWHAGDLGTVEVLDELRAFRPTRGVHGNVDGGAVLADLPRDLTWQCDGVRVYMTHIGGYPGRYEPRVRRELDRVKPDLFITGHSHILKIMRDPARQLIHMNPGACGHNGWHLVRTVLRFTIDGSTIGNVEAIELGPRGRNAAGPKPRKG